MVSIIGKVLGQFHMADKVVQANAAKNYRRNPHDPNFPFGKGVTLIVAREYWGWVENRVGQRGWGINRGGAGYYGIILGPKLNPDGSVDEDVIGIGTYNEILDFEIDPKASPDENGHTILMPYEEGANDFAEITGMWNGKKLSG